jgi:hypothetical protein
MATFTCQATKADGEPCRNALGIGPSGFCIQHDPDRQEEAAAIRAAGTAASSERSRSAKSAVRLPDPGTIPPPMETAEDVPKWASWLAHQTLLGNIDSVTSREVGKLIATFKQGHDYSEGQGKVRELKRQLRELQKSKR